MGDRALQIVPHTAADNFYSIADGTPTTMALLQNLVPSPGDVDQWVCRPAAVKFSGSAGLLPVSCQIVVGSKLFGMAQNAGFPGMDIPFCFDLLGTAFISISGVTGANIPTAPPTTGTWNPPHMELVGINIVVTHVGFSGTGTNFFGLIDITNLGAPVWSSSNITAGTGGSTLPAVPIWVSQFNSRAYFLVNPANAPPAAIFTDINNPASFFAATTAPYNNVVTFGGNLPLNCSGTVAFDNQLGGQTQALVVFQQLNNMWQITGDPAATSNATTNISQGPFAINSLNVATGTLAPNSLCQTPKGLAFIAPDGLRVIDFSAHVSDPIGYAGAGICIPFVAATVPTRIAAACNATTIRVSTINGSLINTPQQEWCYDIARAVWFGPHTLPISLISFYGTSYICTLIGQSGIWQSDITPNSGSVYTENAAPMPCIWQSGYCPDRPNMNELSCTRAVFYQAFGEGTVNYTIAALDHLGNIKPGSPVFLSFTGDSTTWGSFAWGFSTWLGTASTLQSSQVPWTQPLVFDRMSIQISFNGGPGIAIADFLLDVDEEGYTVT